MSTELLTTLFMLAVCILATVGATAIIKIIRSHPKKEPPDNIRFMSLPEHLRAHERVHRFYGTAGTYFDVVIRGEFPTDVTINAVKVPLDCYEYASPLFSTFKALAIYNDSIIRALVKPTIDDCRSYDEKLTALENRQEILDRTYSAIFDRIEALEELGIKSREGLDIGKQISDGLIAGLENPNEKVTEAISKITEKTLADINKPRRPIGFTVPDNDAEEYTGCCDCAGYDTCPTCKRNPERLPELPVSTESELRRFVQNDLYSILHDSYEDVVGCFYNSNGKGDGVITITLMNAPSATLDIHEATATKLEIINRAAVVIEDIDF